MPHTKSAWKRLKQSEKRRVRNRARIKAIKRSSKELSAAVASGDAGKITTATSTYVKMLDKAAARGVIHRNKAARLKSRLQKRIERETRQRQAAEAKKDAKSN